MKLSLTDKAKTALVVLAIFSLCAIVGIIVRKFEKRSERKGMTLDKIESVIESKFERGIDSLTRQISAQKETIYAQGTVLEALLKANKKNNAALLAVSNALKQHGSALKSTLYLDATTKVDSVLASITLGHEDSARVAEMLDALDARARRIYETNPPPLTWTQKDPWVDQSFTYHPQDRGGYFSLLVRNKFTINAYEKDKKHFVQILNENPFTFTEEGTNLFEIPKSADAGKKKRISVGIQVGGGLTKDLTPTPYLGIGVSYNILSFW